MSDALYWLLGIDAEAAAQGGAWSLEWRGVPGGGDTAFLMLLGCAVMVALFWWLYRQEAGQLTGKARYLLLSLRVALAALVVIMLLEPAVVLSRIEQRPSQLLVLVDTSQSMGLSDAWIDPQAAADAARVAGLNDSTDLAKTTRIALARKLLSPEMLAKLEKDGQRNVHIHRFDERLGGTELDLTGEDTALKLGGRSTAVGEAIQQLVQAYQGQDLAGVVVLTDGQNTTPNASSLRATAQVAADTGVAIFPVGLGTLEGPRNAQVTKLEGQDVVFINDKAKLTAVITARGLEDEPATLILERLTADVVTADGEPADEDWQQVDSKDIVLAADATPRTVDFDLLPTEKETIIYRARLAEVQGEIDPDDNAALKQVNVVSDKTRVLFIAGYTFPEVQFIRNTLIRDATVELSSWLQTASDEFKHPGNAPIRRLPIDLVELAGGTKNGVAYAGYDCIVLYDPSPTKWPSGFSDLLNRFVTERGGGLVYIAGERYTQELFTLESDPAASYMGLLPVVRDPGLFRTATQMELSRARPWKLQITDAGWRDPIFAFDADAVKNRKILDQLPGMMWHMPVSRAKPGATVLARHNHPGMTVDVGGRQEQEVLMATQLVGPGRVLWIGFDSTYRWRFAGESIFDGFWQRVIDRAGLMKQLGGQHPYRVSTDKQRYEPGDEVVLTATFIDPEQVDDGLLSLYAQVQTGQDEPIDLTMTPTGDGLAFTARFEAQTAGDYLVRVWPGDSPAQRSARPNTHGFTVQVPDFETRNPTLAKDELTNLALASGGQFFTFDRADLLPDALTVGLVDNELIHFDEVWNAPLLILLFLAAILTEWIVRKRRRLV